MFRHIFFCYNQVESLIVAKTQGLKVEALRSRESPIPSFHRQSKLSSLSTFSLRQRRIIARRHQSKDFALAIAREYAVDLRATRALVSGTRGGHHGPFCYR
jgi:hypothetical protein